MEIEEPNFTNECLESIDVQCSPTGKRAQASMHSRIFDFIETCNARQEAYTRLEAYSSLRAQPSFR